MSLTWIMRVLRHMPSPWSNASLVIWSRTSMEIPIQFHPPLTYPLSGLPRSEIAFSDSSVLIPSISISCSLPMHLLPSNWWLNHSQRSKLLVSGMATTRTPIPAWSEFDNWHSHQGALNQTKKSIRGSRKLARESLSRHRQT